MYKIVSDLSYFSNRSLKKIMKKMRPKITSLFFYFFYCHANSLIIIQLYLSQVQMSKQIEMFEISDKNPVGTEIFDPNLPSNIDFQDQRDRPNKKIAEQQQKKLPELGKVLIIGDEIKSFRVKGKLIANFQPRFKPGVAIIAPLHTHPVKMQDEQVTGFKKLWSSIVGHCKRELLVQEGFIYLFEREKQGLFLKCSISLGNLFKVFVDPEEQMLRLVVTQGEQTINKDLFPDNFLLATEMINHQLLKIGLSLVE